LARLLRRQVSTRVAVVVAVAARRNTIPLSIHSQLQRELLVVALPSSPRPSRDRSQTTVSSRWSTLLQVVATLARLNTLRHRLRSADAAR
jgi:hypothetical protein